MKSIIKIQIIIFVFIFLGGCSHDHKDHDHAHDEPHEHEEHGPPKLSKQQVELMNVTLGQLSRVKINDYVGATGTLGLPPNALTSVSARDKGFIRQSNKYVEGSYVKKGVVMAYLENPDFIDMQQSLLQLKAELSFSEKELARQESLLNQEAGIMKNVEKFQSEVDVLKAQYNGMAKRLSYIGIDPSLVNRDNIRNRVAIVAPMSGFITSIKMHNGKYVTPEMELMEIVNDEHVHLELDVFEKDISKIKEEQNLTYSIPAMGDEIYQGEVHIIGKEFNQANKTVRVHGHLVGDRPPFIKDLFVNAKIWLNDATVDALPEQAIVRDGEFEYVFVTQSKVDDTELIFKKIMVKTGGVEDGFKAIQLLEPVQSGEQFVTGGAYFILAQEKAGELSHEH